MKLNVKERVILLHTLGDVRGNIMQLRILRQLREDLSFSEKEHKNLDLKLDELSGRYTWKPSADRGKDIEIGDVARNIIVERLRELNKEGLLMDDHLDIIEKFPGVEDAQEKEK